MSAADMPCEDGDIAKLYPNPNDPHSYYQCTPEGLQLLPCPAGTVFDPEVSRCEWPSEAE